MAPNELAARLVRHKELRPCTTAFIDTRTPGSERKENFTIIGPGVAENPDQHVHISLPHGFNVGGARQPPRCVNSQHSHDTAEVFIVHTGIWRFMTGENADDGSVELRPGDVISIPTKVFRGFENIGNETGFMFAVLGGDDPGRVTWAPYVFDAARAHSLVLLESGRLVDTAKESLPANARPMPKTTVAQARSLQRIDSTRLQSIVWRFESALRTLSDARLGNGISEFPVCGVASPLEHIMAGKMDWPHGFQLRCLHLPAGSSTGLHCRSEIEVLMAHRNSVTVECDGSTFEVGPGDTFSLPVSAPRRFSNRHDSAAYVYVVRGGDHPAAARPLCPA